jgi:hypothetical protein
MQDWHSTCLGRRTLPRDLSAFEIEAFFNFSASPMLHGVLSKIGEVLRSSSRWRCSSVFCA